MKDSNDKLSTNEDRLTFGDMCRRVGFIFLIVLILPPYMIGKLAIGLLKKPIKFLKAKLQ